MKAFHVILILIVAWSCQVQQNPTFQKTDRVEHDLKKYLIGELNKFNDDKTDNYSFGIWIRLISATRNNNAVYNFGQTGSHTSRKSFFLFEHGKIDILDESDTVNFYKSLDKFFDRNAFSPASSDSSAHLIQQIMREKNINAF